MADHATGYLIDHPLNVASLESDKRWPMELLLEGRPALAVPDEYLDPSVSPTALDQDGVGACVAFAGETIKQAQDRDDWGSFLYTSQSAFTAYNWLKHGHGSFPGDGIPDSEGSYPEALWRLALTEGLPDAAGRTHKITAYYSHELGSEADDQFVEQVILQFGPVNVGIPWYWSASPQAPEYKVVWGGVNGAHSVTIAGWKRYAGVRWWSLIQTWGTDWSNAMGLYRAQASWFHETPLGPQIVWKTVDAPDAPSPPAPDPEDPVLTVVDKVARLVDTSVGKPVYRLDGTTQLTTISSGPTNIASSCALSGGFYGVIVSVGGVLQLAAMRQADLTNVRVLADPSAAVATERKRWTDWLGTYPK